jgi:alpha-galactosidase
LTYRVRVLRALTTASFLDAEPVPWIADGEIALAGSLLSVVGVRTPLLAPASALVIEAEAIG